MCVRYPESINLFLITAQKNDSQFEIFVVFRKSEEISAKVFSGAFEVPRQKMLLVVKSFDVCLHSCKVLVSLVTFFEMSFFDTHLFRRPLLRCEVISEILNVTVSLPKQPSSST